MILVDTSAWVELFRGRDPFASAVDALLASNEVALCGPVLTDLRRGLRSPAERRRVLPLFAHQVPLLTRDSDFRTMRGAGIALSLVEP